MARAAHACYTGDPAKDFADVPSRDNDAVLLLKQYTSSSTLSQLPLLLFPVYLLDKLKDRELRVSPRNQFTERTIEEF